jgi:hypothetical protein
VELFLSDADAAVSQKDPITINLLSGCRDLEGFDTLFNKRDYVAAEKFWSPHYIQHSAHGAKDC